MTVRLALISEQETTTSTAKMTEVVFAHGSIPGGLTAKEVMIQSQITEPDLESESPTVEKGAFSRPELTVIV